MICPFGPSMFEVEPIEFGGPRPRPVLDRTNHGYEQPDAQAPAQAARDSRSRQGIKQHPIPGICAIAWTDPPANR